MKRVVSAVFCAGLLATPTVGQGGDAPGEAPDPDSCIYDPDRPIFDSTVGLHVELRSWSSDDALPLGWQTATGYAGDYHMVTVSKNVCTHYYLNAAVISPIARHEENLEYFKRLLAVLHLPEDPPPVTQEQWDTLQRTGEVRVLTESSWFVYNYTANDAFYTYSFHHQFMVP